MRTFIWYPAVLVPAIAVGISVGLFIGIAAFLEIFHDFALALGTALFIIISAGAWLLARRTEREHAARNPEQASDSI